MAGKSITPDHIQILAEIGAQCRFNCGGFNCPAFGRFDKHTRVILSHSPEGAGTIAAAEAIKRDSAQERMTDIIHVEVSKHTAVL